MAHINKGKGPPPAKGDDTDSDEGFVSPSNSIQRVVQTNKTKSDSETNSGSSDSESQADSASSSSGTSSLPQHTPPSSEGEDVTDSTPKIITNAVSPPRDNVVEAVGGKSAVAKDVMVDAVEKKAESLAMFIVSSLLSKTNGLDSSDPVERTLLKCVNLMNEKHAILFKGMMKRLQVTRETGYISFVTVANTLFEDNKVVVTWSRIVALYAFGGQLAIYCKEKDMEDFAYTIAGFMGKYAKDVLTPYVTSIGGWNKICEEFPEERDIENKIRRVLSWTAVGLGVAATVSYLTSR